MIDVGYDAFAVRAGYPFDFTRIRRETFMPAMIASYDKDLGPLMRELEQLPA